MAIALLRNEGLLRVEKGLGIFVAASSIRYPIGKRVRYNETLQAQGRKGGYQLLHVRETFADAKIAQNLELVPNVAIAQSDMLCLADDQPIGIASSYFPLQRFPDILQQLETAQSISKLMREVYNCDHIRRSTSISARPVRTQDSRLLNISPNQPILLVESVNVDQHGQVIEYTVTRFRGDSMELMLQDDD